MKKASNKISKRVWAAGLVLIALLLFFALHMGNRKSSFEELTEYPIRTEFRNLLVYEFDSIVKRMPYKLIITENDSAIIYSYKNLEDSRKDIGLQYQKQTASVFFAQQEFQLSIKNAFHTDISFDEFTLTEVVNDGEGPILFNPIYGVLGWDNGWGMQFYFLTVQNMESVNLPILQ